jgi:hypothetical protein
MEKKWRHIIMKTETYDKVEEVRKQVGLRSLSQTLNHLIDEYKKTQIINDKNNYK